MILVLRGGAKILNFPDFKFFLKMISKALKGLQTSMEHSFGYFGHSISNNNEEEIKERMKNKLGLKGVKFLSYFAINF